MSQQHLNVAQTVRNSIGGSANPRTQSDLTLDLIIIEAGLRLKVLPLRDAILKGRKLRLSELERHARRSSLFDLCGNTQHSIVDIGLFADAVARRPDVAERLWRALRSPALR